MRIPSPHGQRASTFLVPAVAGCCLLLSACGRPDLTTSSATHAKLAALKADRVLTDTVQGAPPDGAPLLSEGSAGRGPGDSPTNGLQTWKQARFGPDTATLLMLRTYVEQRAMVGWTYVQCAGQQWTLEGERQLGPWIASVSLFATRSKVQINEDLNVGDEGRDTLSHSLSSNRAAPTLPPDPSCPKSATALLRDGSTH